MTLVMLFFLILGLFFLAFGLRLLRPGLRWKKRMGFLILGLLVFMAILIPPGLFLAREDPGLLKLPISRLVQSRVPYPKDDQTILVFYKPDCPYCQDLDARLKTEFQDALENISASGFDADLLLGRILYIDTQVNPGLKRAFKIEKVPTVVFGTKEDAPRSTLTQGPEETLVLGQLEDNLRTYVQNERRSTNEP